VGSPNTGRDDLGYLFGIECRRRVARWNQLGIVPVARGARREQSSWSKDSFRFGERGCGVLKVVEHPQHDDRVDRFVSQR
jgi:hypothetical protein